MNATILRNLTASLSMAVVLSLAPLTSNSATSLLLIAESRRTQGNSRLLGRSSGGIPVSVSTSLAGRGSRLEERPKQPRIIDSRAQNICEVPVLIVHTCGLGCEPKRQGGWRKEGRFSRPVRVAVSQVKCCISTIPSRCPEGGLGTEVPAVMAGTFVLLK